MSVNSCIAYLIFIMFNIFYYLENYNCVELILYIDLFGPFSVNNLEHSWIDNKKMEDEKNRILKFWATLIHIYIHINIYINIYIYKYPLIARS